MRSREKLLATGLATMSLLGISACAGKQEYSTPAVILNVNCNKDPHDISVVGFHQPELIKYGDKTVTFEIQDDVTQKYIKLTMLGNTAVNGHPTTSSGAGEIVATLPQAKLYAGVPQHGQNRYYAGDEGVSLACNAAQPADTFNK
jgi:hypothetical protein